MLRNSELFSCEPESELHFLPKRPSSSRGEARLALHATVFTAPSFFSPSFRQSKPNIFVTGEVPFSAPLPPSPLWPSPCNRSPCWMSPPLPFPIPGGWARDFDSLHMECGKETRVSAVSSAQWNNLWSLLFLADYKQKYGEEHGSCQAGIAGVFMEVSNAVPVHLLRLWVPLPVMEVLFGWALAPIDPPNGSTLPLHNSKADPFSRLQSTMWQHSSSGLCFKEAPFFS